MVGYTNTHVRLIRKLTCQKSVDITLAISKKGKRQLRLTLKRQVKKLPRSENRKRSNNCFPHGYRRGASAERPTKVWSRACMYLPKNEERRSAGGYHRALVDTTHFRAGTSNRRRWRYVN